MTLISVRYANSSDDLARPDSFLSLLIADALQVPVRVSTDAKETVDLQLTSVQIPLVRKVAAEAERAVRRVLPRGKKSLDPRWAQTNPSPQGPARAHIWFTGENVRPPAASWDGYLSFDLDPLDGRNAYLPLWWYSVGLLGQASSIFSSAAPTWQELAGGRPQSERRPRFACAFINNPEPMRMHAITALRNVGQVDVFGSAVGRPVSDKAVVASEYRYVLCFENDIYPGYVTEKPIEAWATGAVPLWRGSDPAGYLNPEAMVNAADYSDLQGFADAVAHIDDEDGLWPSMASHPLLAKPPDLDPARELIRRVVGAP